MKHWGFDDRSHHGEMVIHRDQASNLLAIMRELYELRFPIEKMQLVDKYEGNDERSMEANNTSAFNCRDIAGRSGAWSEHAYGRAVDINPVQNPYVAASGKVSPPSGTPYAQRSQQAKGIIHATGPVVRAFQSRGWKWGGNWSSSKDYQHFSVTGR